MKLKKLVAALGVALPLAFAGLSAQSAVTSMVFEDDNVDFLLTPSQDTAGNPILVPKLSGAFAKGDVLFSIFEIPNYSIGGVNALPANMELTGIAAIQIDDIVPGTDNGIGTQLIFKPYEGGLNYFLQGGQTVVQGGAGQGAMVAMYLNSTTDFDLGINFDVNPEANCNSRIECTIAATAGTLLQVDGFAGDLDEFWSSVVTIAGGNDPSAVYAIGGGTGVAQFNAALTTFFNAPGQIAYQDIANVVCAAGGVGADGCFAGPTITGPITGGGGTVPLNAGIRADGAFARSDIDAVKLMQVPEPGTLALAGLSLLGLALARRRQ